MSKLAVAEAAAAKRAAATTPRTAGIEMGNGEDIAREEDRRRELMKRMENNPTLSQIMSLDEKKGILEEKEKER
ncbi:hypothetical protein DITRI_Ditri08aG0163200 [Diplodiscus trichospermus]